MSLQEIMKHNRPKGDCTDYRFVDDGVEVSDYELLEEDDTVQTAERE
jgi:hypothetical protein